MKKNKNNLLLKIILTYYVKGHCEGTKEMFYLMMNSTHFIYDYMALC